VIAMPVIVSGIAVALILALLAGAGYYLGQEPVYRAQPMPSVRVGDPGYNLVGRNWTGNPARNQPTDESDLSAGTGGEGVTAKERPAG
jgi:hypothetical protein